jgi:hypothetical protein
MRRFGPVPLMALLAAAAASLSAPARALAGGGDAGTDARDGGFRETGIDCAAGGRAGWKEGAAARQP